MDKIMPAITVRGPKGVGAVQRDLELIAPLCRWTSGQWDAMSDLKWNEIQNVPRHVQMLSWVLIHSYLKAKEEER
jgi:hypothetical protein